MQRALEALVQEGGIIRLKRNRYAFRQTKQWKTGIIEIHPKGYGFVRLSDLPGKDIFIPPHNLGSANHGDTVSVAMEAEGVERTQNQDIRKRKANPKPDYPNRRGRVVQVLERNERTIIGRLQRQWKQWMIQPLDQRMLFQIYPTNEDNQSWQDGAIVEAKVLVPAGRERPALGRIVKRIGGPGDKDLPLKIVIAKCGIRVDFPEMVLKEASRILPHLDSLEIAARTDFRDWLVITVDGETARDFDDAVSIKNLETGNYLLGVHIADVSHFVREGSAIDREAFLRGNSVYFPDRAVPMLPPVLSNEVCSLQPGKDRLVFSVLMEIDQSGSVVQHHYVKGVIRSAARMTYNSVARILSEPHSVDSPRHPLFLAMIEDMAALCQILQQKRRRRGSVDLDVPEAEVVLDENGTVQQVIRAPKNRAHHIIEEFMLLANETVAEHLERYAAPALFRVHEAPDRVKVREYFELLRTFGISPPSTQSQLTPADFQRINEMIQAHPGYEFLATGMLRTFMQARYSERNLGHFGLASPCYTHFTSPIRRYADLVVHRLLKESLGKKVETAEKPVSRVPWMEQTAKQTSEKERTAEEAEKEMVNYYRAMLMKDRLGESFLGRISRITRQGLGVQVENPFVEGTLNAEYLDEIGFLYRPEIRAFIRQYDRKAYRLGDAIPVMVEGVDIDSHSIRFAPIPPEREDVMEIPEKVKATVKRRKKERV